jgi:transcriptional regulator with XRE-family HTH domain
MGEDTAMDRTPADVLRETIRARGLTAYAVAKLAGLPRPDPVQRFLSGERSLHLDTFCALCRALDLELVEAKRPRSRSRGAAS